MKRVLMMMIAAMVISATANAAVCRFGFGVNGAFNGVNTAGIIAQLYLVVPGDSDILLDQRTSLANGILTMSYTTSGAGPHQGGYQWATTYNLALGNLTEAQSVYLVVYTPDNLFTMQSGVFALGTLGLSNTAPGALSFSPNWGTSGTLVRGEDGKVINPLYDWEEGTQVRNNGTILGGWTPTDGWSSTIPEPTAMALLALGAAAVGLRRRFRK